MPPALGKEGAMKDYLCYAYDAVRAVPYFEVTLAENDEDARQRAIRLLRERPSYVRVELWERDRRLSDVTLQGVG
jgi:hypothetical protein